MALDRIVSKIILDLLILACVGIPLLVLVVWAEPYHRGYFESDESIKLPFKEQSVSETLLGALGFAVVVITVLVVEVFRDRNQLGAGEKFVCGRLCPGWAWEAYSVLGVLLFGAGCQQLTVNLGKYVLGRLRPNFFDVCRPIINYDPVLNQYGYIQNYTCTGTDTKRILDARLSFPSAHSSFSMYMAVFLIFYLQTRSKLRWSKLLRHGVQFAALMGAWYVGLSRVVEHKHHWSDVAAGFAIGAMYAALVFVFVLRPKSVFAPRVWQQPVASSDQLPRPI